MRARGLAVGRAGWGPRTRRHSARPGPSAFTFSCRGPTPPQSSRAPSPCTRVSLSPPPWVLRLGGGPDGPPSPSPGPRLGGRTALSSRDAAREGPGLGSTGSRGVRVAVCECVSVRASVSARCVFERAHGGAQREGGKEGGTGEAAGSGGRGGGQRGGGRARASAVTLGSQLTLPARSRQRAERAAPPPPPCAPSPAPPAAGPRRPPPAPLRSNLGGRAPQPRRL